MLNLKSRRIGIFYAFESAIKEFEIKSYTLELNVEVSSVVKSFVEIDGNTFTRIFPALPLKKLYDSLSLLS